MSAGTNYEKHATERSRDEPFYRFSVKCSREQNKYLERMAAEIGMTVNELVQSAMDGLMAGYDPADFKVKKPVKWLESVHPDTVQRVLRTLISKMDLRGHVEFKVSEISRELKVDGNTFYAAVRTLTRDGRIERLQAGGNARNSILRVLKGLE